MFWSKKLNCGKARWNWWYEMCAYRSRSLICKQSHFPDSSHCIKTFLSSCMNKTTRKKEDRTSKKIAGAFSPVIGGKCKHLSKGRNKLLITSIFFSSFHFYACNKNKQSSVKLFPLFSLTPNGPHYNQSYSLTPLPSDWTSTKASCYSSSIFTLLPPAVLDLRFTETWEKGLGKIALLPSSSFFSYWFLPHQN